MYRGELRMEHVSSSTPHLRLSDDQSTPMSDLRRFSSSSDEDQRMRFNANEEQPVSRTSHYKKVTKPLLERKRRARINKCLDELKDLMTVALQAEGENVSKLEKADILELTVKHLHKLHTARRLLLRNPLEDAQRFQQGYTSCAQEAAGFLLQASAGADVRLGQRLLSHLSSSVGRSLGLALCNSPGAQPLANFSVNVPAPPPSPLLSPSTASASGGRLSPCGGGKSTGAVRKNQSPLSLPTEATLNVSIARTTSSGSDFPATNLHAAALLKRMPIKPEAVRPDSTKSTWRPF